MSLLLYSRRIARAVAGELPARDEEKLRAHLARCDRCRARYDALSAAAEGLAAAAGRTARVPVDRARARLVAALGGGAAAADRTVRDRVMRRRAWQWGVGPVLVLAPAAALILWLRAPAPPSPSPVGAPSAGDVQWRGGKEAEPAAAGTLVIYAARKRPGGGTDPLRVVAELPGSGEGRVSLSEYLAFGVRGLRAPAFVTVLGVEESGAVHVYLPRESGEAPRAGPGAEPTVFRPSIDVGVSHRPGRLAVYALFSPSRLDAQAVRRAAARLRPGHKDARDIRSLGLDADQVAGVLTVEP